MIRRILLAVTLLSGLSGCAPSHYTVSGPGSLQMYLYMPDAAEVCFASSLDGFTLHSAGADGEGYWLVEVAGAAEFSYFYMVDGSPYLPRCRYRERDDFGAENCIFQPGL